MKIDVCSLIKFGEKAHMKSFYEEGIIFMNNLNVFRSAKDGDLRGDKYEALYKQSEVNNLRIFLGENKIGFAEKGLFQLWYDNPKGNIFSMYALKTCENLNDIKIDSECKKFGDTCVFILDMNEFISRFKNAAYRAGYKLVYSPVEYLNVKEFKGKWSVFRKPIQYSYQNEFRFFICRKESDALILKLGSLKYISAITESSKIDTLKISRI